MGKPIIPIALGLVFAGIAAFLTLSYLNSKDQPACRLCPCRLSLN